MPSLGLHAHPMVLKPKKVAKKHIWAFWLKQLHPRKIRRQLVPSEHWTRKVETLSPGTITTIRRFSSTEKAEQYIKDSKQAEDEVMLGNPKHFVIQPVQFFDRKGKWLLERVYRGPDFFRFKRKEGKYFNALKIRLKKKGIDLEDSEKFKEIKEKISKAGQELNKLLVTKLQRGSPEVNFLILDYDLETSKVLIAFIDTEYPNSLREGPL